jgi:hypothetical protein
MSNNKRSLCLREHFFLKIGVVVVMASQLPMNKCEEGGGGRGVIGQITENKGTYRKISKEETGCSIPT